MRYLLTMLLMLGLAAPAYAEKAVNYNPSLNINATVWHCCYQQHKPNKTNIGFCAQTQTIHYNKVQTAYNKSGCLKYDKQIMKNKKVKRPLECQIRFGCLMANFNPNTKCFDWAQAWWCTNDIMKALKKKGKKRKTK